MLQADRHLLKLHLQRDRPGVPNPLHHQAGQAQAEGVHHHQEV